MNEPTKRRSNVFRGPRWQGLQASAPSPAVPCLIKDDCGTCRFINSDYRRSLQTKYEEGLAILREPDVLGDAALLPAVESPRSLGYRTHAKLAVRAGKGEERFAIGLFQPESHRIVDITNCPLHKPSITRLIRDLKPMLESSELTPYEEESGAGDLRYLAIRAAHRTEELMLTFVTTSERPRLLLRRIVNELRQKEHHIQSAHMNVHPERNNSVFGSINTRLVGTDRLRERLCDLDFEIGPSSFFQVNPWQAEGIYRRIENLAGPRVSGDVAWDLYSGVGQISMMLSRIGYRTLGIEQNPQATRDAQNNAIRNRLPEPPQFLAGKVEELYADLPAWARSPNLIVVNPARKGLAEPVREFLRDQFVRTPDLRLIYLSCEVTSLARDLAVITEGRARVRQLEGFDMFPFTDKMEWLAVLDAP